MGWLPMYSHDIFISYAHHDNDPLIEGKPGWVDSFEHLLHILIRGKLGEEIKIFRDRKLRPYGEFSEQLADSLSSSAIFICVLSPRYIKSEWCLWELNEFCQKSGNARVIKVVKTVMDEKEHPQVIKGVLDYRFYKKDDMTEDCYELHPEIDEHRQSLILLVESLAQNVVGLLKEIRGSLSPAFSQPIVSPRKTNGRAADETSSRNSVAVFLAETTKELTEECNLVRKELVQFDYRVLPEHPLSQDIDEIIKVTHDCLTQATISVHLIGSHYGIRPEMEDRSIPHIQYDIATEISKKNPLTQLVWVPTGVNPKQKSQQDFIEYLKNNSHEFLQTKLEDLKTEILNKLKLFSTDSSEEDDADPVKVCLYYHDRDLNFVRPLYTYLTVNEMFKVKLPLKDSRSLQNHKELLQTSDGVILYYGSADEDWFENIWRQIKRHISSVGSKPILAKAIYAGLPPTVEKELLDTEDPMIIKNYGGFNPMSLTPFINKIRLAKGALR